MLLRRPPPAHGPVHALEVLVVRRYQCLTYELPQGWLAAADQGAAGCAEGVMCQIGIHSSVVLVRSTTIHHEAHSTGMDRAMVLLIHWPWHECQLSFGMSSLGWEEPPAGTWLWLSGDGVRQAAFHTDVQQQAIASAFAWALAG